MWCVRKKILFFGLWLLILPHFLVSMDNKAFNIAFFTGGLTEVSHTSEKPVYITFSQALKDNNGDVCIAVFTSFLCKSRN